jgi:hypothetical protein
MELYHFTSRVTGGCSIFEEKFSVSVAVDFERKYVLVSQKTKINLVKMNQLEQFPFQEMYHRIKLIDTISMYYPINSMAI